MASKADFRDRAANMLGILPFGQSLDHQDKTRIESAYDEVYDDLKDEGLAIWATAGSAPDRLTPHVAALMAANCADDYGVSPARYQRIMGKAAIAKREIRALTIPTYESVRDPVDF